MAYRDTILLDSPVDYYEMESATGTDSGSGGRTLTLTGISTGASGKIGSGWTFDGVNDKAALPTFPSITNAWTFEAWIKPNLAGVNDTPTIIRKDGTDVVLMRVRGSALGVNPGQVEVYIDGTFLLSGSAYRVDDGNWHHVVYTQSGNAAKLYVDGVERASATTSQSTFSFGTGTGGYIGSDNNGAAEFFKGTMDEVAIYNTALSAAKVSDHYNVANGMLVATVSPTYDATYRNDTNVEYPPGSNTATTLTVDPTAPGQYAKLRFSKTAMFGTMNPNIFSAKLRVVVSAVNSSQFVYVAPNGDTSKQKGFRAAETPTNSSYEWDVASIINGTSGDTVTIDLKYVSGSGNVTFNSNEATLTGNRPTLSVQFEEAPLTVTLDVPTVTASAVANDPTLTIGTGQVIDVGGALASTGASEPTVEIHDPVNVDAVVMSAYATAQASDASFEEIRTAVIVPTSDSYRAQGTSTWVGGETLQVNYNPATNLSNVIVPIGTTAQKALINNALERFDFPLESLVSGIQSKFGRNYVEVAFGELGSIEGGGTVLGQYLPNGIIYLDPSIETAPASVIRHTLLHEIGHLVDDVYLTNTMKVSIWNALHTASGDMLAPGTLVVDGIALDHGHYWLGGDVYADSVGEAFANAFVRAYSDVVYNYNQFSHNATVEAADKIRAIVTPSLPAALGPFPTRTPAARLYFDALPASLVTGSILSADLRLNVTWNLGGTFSIRTHSPNGRTYNESAEKTTSLAMGTNNVDIKSIFDPKKFASIHIGNVKTTSSQQLTVSALEDPAAATEPALVVRYVVAQGATLTDVTTATAAVNVVEPTVEVTTDPNMTYDAETATAFAWTGEALPVINAEVTVSDTDTVMAGAYDAEVEINTNAWVDLDTPRMIMSRIALTDVNGEPVLPAESDDRYFEATMDTLVGVMRGTSGGTQGLDKDVPIEPSNQIWFRMNEKSGDRAYDRLYVDDANKSAQVQLMLSNVTVGLNDGPENRHHFYFNGDAYAEQYPSSEAQGSRESGIEFTFRTTKKNQFIMGNADTAANTSFTPVSEWALWLVDGRLEVRTWRWLAVGGGNDLQPVQYTYRATTDVADGKWHHVVLQAGYETFRLAGFRTLDTDDWGLELHLDSKLELRRRIPAQGVAGFPDFIGGRPTPFYGDFMGPRRAAQEVARSEWFNGDMTEVVYRYGRVLSQDEISRQRDTLFGIFPAYPETARANTKANDAVIKGNKPRLLVLHFGQMGHEFEVINGKTVKWTRMGLFDKDESRNISENMRYAKDYTDAIEVPFIGWGESDAPNIPSEPEGGFLWTIKNIFGSELNHASGDYRYKDAVTDNYRLIDLELDLNMEDYDIISIVGYPTNEYYWKKFFAPMDNRNAAPMIPVRKQLENLMAQVKDQVISHAKGLYINDPFSAIALGIVDRVEYVPNFKERAVLDTRLGAQVGYMDWHSYKIDPFNGAKPDNGPVNSLDRSIFSIEGEKAAARYLDLHANVRQRVRATVDGLTDQFSWVKTDHIVWQNVNPVNNPPYQESISYEFKPQGLEVDDSFYMNGGYIESALIGGYNTLDTPMTRYYGWVAAPVRNVKVGTVVTTFDNIFYSTTQTQVNDNPDALAKVVDDSIGNPYYDHAISIAVQPGDVWDGKIVSGKVYVNFTESETHNPEGTDYGQILVYDVPEYGNGIRVGDTIKFSDGGTWVVEPKHLKYQWSTHYGSWGGSEINLPNSGGGPDWGWSAGGTRGSGLSGGGGEAMNWSWKPYVDPYNIPVPSMANRAVKWLASEATYEGVMRVSVASAKAQASAGDVEVTTARNEEVELSTARVTMESHNDMDTVDPDVSVLVGTASALARAISPVTEIELSTAQAVATAGQFEFEFTPIDWSEAMVMVLPRQLLTLILEDND